MMLNHLEHAEREFNHVIEGARRARVGRPAEEGEALAWQSIIRARMNRMAEATATADAALTVADENSWPHPCARTRRTVPRVLVRRLR